jgi:hypothetical protein
LLRIVGGRSLSQLKQMHERQPGGYGHAQCNRQIRQRDAQDSSSPGCQLTIIQMIAAVITMKPVIAVAIKARSMRSIAISTPFQLGYFDGLRRFAHYRM